MTGEAAGSQSVDRAVALLSLIAREGGQDVSINRLVAASGLSRPTARRLLLALMRGGLVTQDGATRTYALGPEAYVLGMMAARSFDLLGPATTSLLRLSDESGDSSFLSIRRGAYAVCLHREDGAFPIRTQALQPGMRHPLGVGAGALAMLAALPDAEAEAVMAETAAEIARDHPNYRPEVLRAGITAARARGWSLNPGLSLRNSWGLGVALHVPDGGVIGALSIAALDTRMGPARQETLGSALLREARATEARLARALGMDPAGARRRTAL